MASWKTYCDLASYVRRLEKRVGRLEKKEEGKEKEKKKKESIKTWPDVDTHWEEAIEIVATIRHDITVLETNLEESKAMTTRDTNQAANTLDVRIARANEDWAAVKEGLNTVQNSLGDCFNDILDVRDDLEHSIADADERLQTAIPQMLRGAFEKAAAADLEEDSDGDPAEHWNEEEEDTEEEEEDSEEEGDDSLELLYLLTAGVSRRKGKGTGDAVVARDGR